MVSDGSGVESRKAPAVPLDNSSGNHVATREAGRCGGRTQVPRESGEQYCTGRYVLCEPALDYVLYYFVFASNCNETVYL